MNDQTHTPAKASLQLVILQILTLLTVFTLGGFVAMILVNRLLVTQLAAYGESTMAAASAIIDFMDDILPYLVGFMVSFMLLAVITLGMWLFTKAQGKYRRYGVVVFIVVLAIVIVWLIAGQRTPMSTVPIITPTPIP